MIPFASSSIGRIEQLSPVGEETFTTPGTYTFTVPEGVYSVCAVAIGASGGTAGSSFISASGAGAGALAYENDIQVAPGQQIQVIVGDGGALAFNSSPGDGGDSSFGPWVIAGGGKAGQIGQSALGGLGGVVKAGHGFPGGKGGSPSQGYNGGGGGAGGYEGTGGEGGSGTHPTAGQGGGGGGGGGGNYQQGYSGAPGGGVGLFGTGANGAAGVSANVPSGGKGGSGGKNGADVTGNFNPSPPGGRYGGAPGPGAGNSGGTKGTTGAVRVMWGNGRAFPNNAA